MATCFTPEALIPSSCFILLWWCKSNCRVSLIDRLSWAYNCFVLVNYQQYEHKHQSLLQLFSTISVQEWKSPQLLWVPRKLSVSETWPQVCCLMQPSTLLLRGVSQSATHAVGFLTFESVRVLSPTLREPIRLNLLCCCVGRHPLKWTGSLPFSTFLTKHIVPAKQHVTKQMKQASCLSH